MQIRMMILLLHGATAKMVETSLLEKTMMLSQNLIGILMRRLLAVAMLKFGNLLRQALIYGE